jgi:hypothetical protein
MASGRHRKGATRLREKAATTEDLTIRTELLAMARQYEVLAESIERDGTDQKA